MLHAHRSDLVCSNPCRCGMDGKKMLASGSFAEEFCHLQQKRPEVAKQDRDSAGAALIAKTSA